MIFVYMIVCAIIIAGTTEWLKNFLPETLKNQKIFMSVFVGIISVVVGSLLVFIPGVIPSLHSLNIILKLGFIGGIIALTQTCYTLLFKTFKTIKNYLTEKIKSLK